MRKNEGTLKICKEVFYEYQKYDNVDKKIVDELYDEIKKDYKKLYSYGQLDISKERIRINKSLGKYNDTINKKNEINKSIFILIITGMFSSLLKYIEITFKAKYLPEGISYILYIFVSCYFIYTLFKDDMKSNTKEKDLVNNLSLIILDQIEKDLDIDKA